GRAALSTALAARQVRVYPGGTFAADQSRAELSQDVRVDVHRVTLHPSPPCRGEALPVAVGFPEIPSSAPGWAPRPPRRCSRWGSSRARPRAHRLLTVP